MNLMCLICGGDGAKNGDDLLNGCDCVTFLRDLQLTKRWKETRGVIYRV
jgi:hypothetical protein